jgi:hypothetical protein
VLADRRNGGPSQRGATLLVLPHLLTAALISVLVLAISSIVAKPTSSIVNSLYGMVAVADTRFACHGIRTRLS